MQEVWEALSEDDMKDAFVTNAMDLDVSQVLAYYSNYTQSDLLQRSKLEELWSSGSKSAPWVNVLALAFKYMEDEEYVSWNKTQLTNLGKFAAILSPAEIELIPAENFDSSVTLFFFYKK